MTPEQLRQLKSLKRSARINRVVLQVFDFWTDLVFLASVYVQSKRAAIDTDIGDNNSGILLEWLASTSSAGLPTNETISSPEDRDLYNILFYAGITLMLVNSGWRFLLAVASIRRHSEISGHQEWSKWLIGVAVTVFEPKTGLDLIDSVMDIDHIYEDDKKYLKRESRLQASMILFENLPMFIIQVVYATSSSGSFAVAWYVSIVVTILHLVAQLLELISVVHRYVFTHKENPLDLRDDIANGVENVRLSMSNAKFGTDDEEDSLDKNHEA